MPLLSFRLSSLRRSVVAAAAAVTLGSVVLAAPVAAKPLKVVASIAPVHSLAAALIADDGALSLLVPPGASPHTYSLKPSAATDLAQADVIFWVGPDMETFLPRVLESLGNGAQTVALSHVPGVMVLPARTGGVWGDGHHHHGEADPDGEIHHDQDLHKTGEKAEALDHDHDHDHEAEKDHDHEAEKDHDHQAGVSDTDPHMWLDPANARVWVAAMAQALSQADPDRRADYERRAANLTARLTALEKALTLRLAPVRGVPYLVFHDAYHYYERRFGLTPVGALSIDPSQPMGARRLAELKAHIRETGARCIFGEPQFSMALPSMLSDGSSAQVAVADPLGQGFIPGPNLYFQAQIALADAFSACLGRAS